MSDVESNGDSSLSMEEDESSNSGPEIEKEQPDSSSDSSESSSENDSSRSGSSTPESSEESSSSDAQGLSTNFVPFKPQKPLLTLEELKSSDYEVWTVSVPGNLNPNKLHDLELSFSKSTKFSLGQENYETVLRPEKEELQLLISSKQGGFHLTSTTISGHMAIVDDVGLPDQDENQPIPTKRIPELPQNLKRRHPIYGHGFEAPPRTKKAKKIKKEKGETLMPVKEKIKKKKKKSSQ